MATDEYAPASEAGDGYLIRSEERLHVDTDQVQVGRARLEKYTVTETRTITVEVSRDEVRLVHEAISGEVAAPAPPTAPGGGPNAREPGWLILTEERIVVTKQVVPVERVRLDLFGVTENQEVTGQLRREQIELLNESRPTSPDNAPKDLTS